MQWSEPACAHLYSNLGSTAIKRNKNIFFQIKGWRQKHFSEISFVFDIVGVNNQDGIFLALFGILPSGLESGFADGDQDVVMVG